MTLTAPAHRSPGAPAQTLGRSLSRFASWRALENAADRYASYGALGVALAGMTLALLVL